MKTEIIERIEVKDNFEFFSTAIKEVVNKILRCRTQLGKIEIRVTANPYATLSKIQPSVTRNKEVRYLLSLDLQSISYFENEFPIIIVNLRNIKKDEVKGVVAHELMHVINWKIGVEQRVNKVIASYTDFSEFIKNAKRNKLRILLELLRLKTVLSFFLKDYFANRRAVELGLGKEIESLFKDKNLSIKIEKMKRIKDVAEALIFLLCVLCFLLPLRRFKRTKQKLREALEGYYSLDVKICEAIVRVIKELKRLNEINLEEQTEKVLSTVFNTFYEILSFYGLC